MVLYSDYMNSLIKNWKILEKRSNPENENYEPLAQLGSCLKFLAICLIKEYAMVDCLQQRVLTVLEINKN